MTYLGDWINRIFLQMKSDLLNVIHSMQSHFSPCIYIWQQNNNRLVSFRNMFWWGEHYWELSEEWTKKARKILPNNMSIYIYLKILQTYIHLKKLQTKLLFRSILRTILPCTWIFIHHRQIASEADRMVWVR